MLKFRDLRADEIDCRVATISEKGLSLLLYKDARCDMNILDETVGAMNWQRSHSRDNANCVVSLWDAEKGQWISKEDTGTESNTEAAKGLASDSFKRACFNWGIGRELYTAPFIWITADKFNVSRKNDGKATTYDKFEVVDIKIEDKKITGLSIRNCNTKQIVYTLGKITGAKRTTKKPADDGNEIIKDVNPIDDMAALKSVGNELKALCAQFEYPVAEIVEQCKLNKQSLVKDYVAAINYVKGRAIAEGKF